MAAVPRGDHQVTRARGGVTGVVAPESFRARNSATGSGKRALVGVLAILSVLVVVGAVYVRRLQTEETHQKLAAEWQQKPGRLGNQQKLLGDAEAAAAMIRSQYLSDQARCLPCKC